MTARELIEEGVDLDRGAERVAQILMGNNKATSFGPNVFMQETEPEITRSDPKPARKRRSDAGKPKAKKQEAPAGVLTSEQAAHLDKLVTAMSETKIAAQDAEQLAYNACADYYSYLAELQGKRR